MAQHDYDIANQSGAAFRSDLNNALDAIVTTNSGSTEPATTFAFQFWADTNANQLKMRNAANDGWIVILETDGEVPAKTFTGDITLNAQSDVRFADSDSSNWVAFQAPATVSSNVTWTLPDTDATTSGQALVSDSSGTLSWAAVSGDISDTAPERTFTNTTEEDTDGGRESKITFKGEQSGGEVSTLAQIEASHDGTSDDEKGQIVFRTNDGSDGSSPTDAMTILSNGNVGIGNSSPQGRLHIANDQGGGIGRIILDANVSSGYDSKITQNDTGLEFHSVSGSRGFQFLTGTGSGTERLRILSGGGLTFNGDTAAANALDDYEEGTCTISFLYASGGAYYGVSFSTTPNTTAYYRKVGGIVTVVYYTSSIGISGGAGYPARIDGLPFLSAITGNPVVNFTHNTLFNTTVNGGYVQPNSSHFFPISDNATSAATYQTGGTRYMMLTVTYFTDL